LERSGNPDSSGMLVEDPVFGEDYGRLAKLGALHTFTLHSPMKEEDREDEFKGETVDSAQA
jgi:hypothetical protein